MPIPIPTHRDDVDHVRIGIALADADAGSQSSINYNCLPAICRRVCVCAFEYSLDMSWHHDCGASSEEVASTLAQLTTPYMVVFLVESSTYHIHV